MRIFLGGGLLEASTDDIDAKLLELQKELLQKASNRDDYDSIAEENFQLGN